jgi:FKBP-type peptidyl-prolyl cis-trans isomerase SlyD
VKLTLEPEDASASTTRSSLRVEPREISRAADRDRHALEGVPGDREDETLIYTVTDVTPESVVVDGNHPLAGERLWFRAKVSDVRAATEEELQHGHVHGVDGLHTH